VTDTKSTVGLMMTRPEYPRLAPFDPSSAPPEYPFGTDGVQTAEDNDVYRAFRDNLVALGLDQPNLGTGQWNPLRDLVREGGCVLIKPNLVVSEHHLGVEGLLGTLANAAVIRAAIDYAWLAVGPAGTIIVGDCPIKEVDFERVCAVSGLTKTVDTLRARGVPVSLVDFRDLVAVRDTAGVIVSSQPLPGDPLGATEFDLGRESLFGQLSEQECRRLRSTAAVYEDAASANHTPAVNRYSLTNSVLAADLVISIAKFKSHRKSGMTGALKNVIGMTNEKRWLPHHRVGTPAQGGDICPDDAPATRKVMEHLIQRANASRNGRLLYRVLIPGRRLARTVRTAVRGSARPASDIGEGNWWGNDTIWRTTLDMNVLARYGALDGTVGETPHRSWLAITDAILAGDGEGPLHPTPKPVGALLASLDPVACDVVATRLAGFDPARIPTAARAHEAARPLGINDPARIVVATADGTISPDDVPSHAFRPSSGWRGHIELAPSSAAVAVAGGR
jgi:uncharacterized protein (DUF362 family)